MHLSFFLSQLGYEIINQTGFCHDQNWSWEIFLNSFPAIHIVFLYLFTLMVSVKTYSTLNSPNAMIQNICFFEPWEESSY